MKTANVLSEALQEILFVVLDIVSVAESADQFCSRAEGNEAASRSEAIRRLVEIGLKAKK